MDALSAPVIAPALPGGDADAGAPTQNSEVSAEFAALVASLMSPPPGLPVPVEDATSAPTQPDAGVVDAVAPATVPVPVLPFSLPVSAPVAAAPALPAPVDEAATPAPTFVVASTPSHGVDATKNEPTPPTTPSLEAALTLTPVETQSPGATTEPAEPVADTTEVALPDGPARPERPAAIDVPAPITAPEAAERTVETPVFVADGPADEPLPVPSAAATAAANAPVPVAAPAPPAPVAPTAHVAPAPHVQVAEVVGQLRHVDGSHEVTLDLNPAELGPVKVTMTVDGSNVTLHLRAENPATDDLLRRHLPDLQASLAEAGLNATSVDVGGSAPERWQFEPEGAPTGSSVAPAADEPAPTPSSSTGSSSARLDVLL